VYYDPVEWIEQSYDQIFLVPEKGTRCQLDYLWPGGILATVRSRLVAGPETGGDENLSLISLYPGYDEEEKDEAYQKRIVERLQVFLPFATSGKLSKSQIS